MANAKKEFRRLTRDAVTKCSLCKIGREKHVTVKTLKQAARKK